MHSLIHVVHARTHADSRIVAGRASQHRSSHPPPRPHVRGHAAHALARAAQRLDPEGARRAIA